GGTFANNHGGPKVVAIALNTFHLNEAEAREAIAQVQAKTGLPCTDVIRFDPTPILDAIFTP
ncbi:MAG: DUF1611 domain-containing protein, partial [Leptolyngbyaceae cyanobacterium]